MSVLSSLFSLRSSRTPTLSLLSMYFPCLGCFPFQYLPRWLSGYVRNLPWPPHPIQTSPTLFLFMKSKTFVAFITIFTHLYVYCLSPSIEGASGGQESHPFCSPFNTQRSPIRKRYQCPKRKANNKVYEAGISEITIS